MFITNPIDKETIVNNLPNIKLSYENVIHKKVYKSDIIFAIPRGEKCFAWFTYYLNEPVCFILKLVEKKQISTIQIIHVSYNPSLSLGTIFYGTLFNHLNNTYFTVEDVVWYKGQDVSTSKWFAKFEIINTIMHKELNQLSYGSKFVIFGLPVLSNDINDILLNIKTVNYSLHSLQFMLFNNCNKHLCLSINDLNKDNHTYNNIPNHAHDSSLHTAPINNKPINTKPTNNKPINTKPINTKPTNNKPTNNKPTNNQLIFNVNADLQNDIYNLYCYDNSELVYYNIACVPTYATSVMLNNLFRTIKENNNLDALEESDDENEFQNENVDRYVDLSKNYKMLCGYNFKFKKWTPIKVVTDNAVCQLKDLCFIK